MGHDERRADALDLLEQEDRKILASLAAIEGNRGQSVEQRAVYGDLVKRLTRELAARESALVEVAEAIESAPGLAEVRARLTASTVQRRSHMDRVERQSRGINGLYLNVSQDVDADLAALSEIVRPEIVWELGEGLPSIRAAMSDEEREQRFRSARYLRRHAPTNLHPERPRWWERAPVVSRVLTIFDHLRDFPTAAKRPGSS